MADLPETTSVIPVKAAKNNLGLGKVTRFVIMSGWILLILVCFMTILAIVYMSVFTPGVPIGENLEKLAFAATGFLFGSFPSLLKELLNIPGQNAE